MDEEAEVMVVEVEVEEEEGFIAIKGEVIIIAMSHANRCVPHTRAQKSRQNPAKIPCDMHQACCYQASLHIIYWNYKASFVVLRLCSDPAATCQGTSNVTAEVC